MAELKNYVEGQAIEPMKPRVYTTIEEQAELNAYREFGNLSQLRVLCDNYHELIDELRNNRATEAEIRAKAYDGFMKEIEAEYDNDACPNVADYLDYKISLRDLFRIADQLKERD